MKKLPLLTLASATAIGILWACGGGDDSDDSIIPYDGSPDVVIKYDTGIDGPDPATGQGTTFCDSTLGAIRAAIAGCCSPAEGAGLPLDVYKNINIYVTACEKRMESSIAQHRTAPTPADVDACINGYKAVFGTAAAPSCGGLDKYRSFDVLSPSCAKAFVGKGTPDSPCAGDFDCVDGLACVGYTDTADGTCKTLVPQNGTCGVGAGSNVSAPDLVLTPRNSCASGQYCNAGICAPTTASGNDAGCGIDEQCDNKSCIDQHCFVPTPGPRIGAGGYCHVSSDCNTGLYCNGADVAPDDGGAPPGATGTCEVSLTTPGATCDPANAHQCAGQCNTGNTCDRLCTFP